MKLLVLTQKVDEQDDVLGFFHEWLRRLADKVETLEVICLSAGHYKLPHNTRVHSLGKEEGKGRLARLMRLYRLLWKLRSEYDAVFVHMNPEYLVAAGWWWKLSRKKTLLWYSHRSVDLKLRVAAFFADTIASSSATSFRLKTPKLHVLGHGIDTELFSPAPKTHGPRWRLVSVGRITPIKRLTTAVEALALLRGQGIDAELALVGQAGTGDKAYERQLKEQIKTLSLEQHVRFAGPVPYGNMSGVYHGADVSINLAPTGGLDKAVLESMAAGLPTLLSNKGFADFLGPYEHRLLFAQDDAADLALKLAALYHASDRAATGAYLREQVVKRAGLDRLVAVLMSLLWPNK